MIKEYFEKRKKQKELEKIIYKEIHKPIYYKDYNINKLSNYNSGLFYYIKLLIDYDRVDIIDDINLHNYELIQVKIINHGECPHCNNDKIQIGYTIRGLSPDYMGCIVYENRDKYTKIYCNNCGSIFEK